jgi:hypothetical protein
MAVMAAAMLAACSSSTHLAAPASTATSIATSAATATATTASTSTEASPATSTSASAPTSTAAAAAPVGQPSATQLKAMALATSDLPFGWAVSPPSTDNSVTSPCPAITADAGRQLPAQAETDLQQSEEGPFVQDILATGTPQQVQALFASFQKPASRCSTSGSDTTRLSAASSPSYGDESYALHLTATRSGVSYSGDIAVVRKGQVLIEVVVFGGGGVPPSFVQDLVTKAVNKV